MPKQVCPFHLIVFEAASLEPVVKTNTVTNTNAVKATTERIFLVILSPPLKSLSG
jgi:hypothetical protein